MKKAFGIGVVFLVGAVLLFSLRSNQVADHRKKISIGTQILAVEIADDSFEITKGLSGRDRIGSDGMLFQLPTRTRPGFWMKDMKFPLDFLWIDGQKVVEITEEVLPQFAVADQYLQVYTPKVPVTAVLEMHAGEVKKRGIRVGDTVQIW